MSRRRRTVQYLAEQAGLPSDFALELLREANVPVSLVRDVVKTSALHGALVALGLARPPKPARRVEEPKPAPRTTSVEPLEPARRERKRKQVRSEPIIGRRQPLSFLNFDSVEAIHWVLVQDFLTSRDPIDPPGVRSADLLHSALSRCETSLGQEFKYPTAPMAAAALLHSAVLNHAFYNGNKRTGLVASLVFLDSNGWSLHVDEDLLFDFLLKVASHELTDAVTAGRYDADAEVLAIARWLHRYIRRTEAARRRFKFHDLRSLLLKHGCGFERPRGGGNRIKVTRGGLKTQVWYGGEGRDVAPNTIPKLREDLQMDYEHGFDDWTFYNAEERVPDFVARYRRTLDRLAKT